LPAHRRPLGDVEGPLADFARELRALRDSASPPVPVREIARPTGKYKPEDPRRDRPAKQTIYAALSGKQLPTEETLEVMVQAWAANGKKDLHYWRTRRREVQEKLALSAEERSTKPFSHYVKTLFQDVLKIIDHSVEAAAFHRKLATVIDKKRKNPILTSGYPEKTAYAVYSGYRLPSEDVLNDFIRIAEASDEEVEALRELWRSAVVSVGYLAAMVILAGGQGLMANAELREMSIDAMRP
jgi:hypothetical protein